MFLILRVFNLQRPRRQTAALPRQHLFGIFSLLLLLGSVILWPMGKHEGTVLQDFPIELPDLRLKVGLPTVLENLNEAELFAVKDEELGIEKKSADPQWQNYQVKRGDTLSHIFKNFSLPSASIYNLVRVDKGRVLSRLEPGQQIDFLVDADNIIQELRIRLSLKQSAIFKRQDKRYIYQLQSEKTTWAKRQYKGQINGNFYDSARQVGITPNQVKQIGTIFQNKLNFKRDLQLGDQFHVLMNHEEIEGQKTGLNELLAIEFFYRGQHLAAYFNPSDNNYYDSEGLSLNNAFLRTPFRGSYRLASRFNLERKHPVTGQIRPHYGVDFATPVGTPILATSDGVVEVIGSHPIAGKYIVIRHNNKYSTRYLHLDKFFVKKGDNVRMGSIIAHSGNTGRTSGAHIHYELRIHNRPVDPMRVSIPMTKQLSGENRTMFLAKVKDYQRALQS